jgi:hypothetical protein
VGGTIFKTDRDGNVRTYSATEMQDDIVSRSNEGTISLSALKRLPLEVERFGKQTHNKLKIIVSLNVIRH